MHERASDRPWCGHLCRHCRGAGSRLLGGYAGRCFGGLLGRICVCVESVGMEESQVCSLKHSLRRTNPTGNIVPGRGRGGGGLSSLAQCIKKMGLPHCLNVCAWARSSVQWWSFQLRSCVCARAHARVRVRAHVCVHVCVRVCVRAWEAREGEGGFGTEPSLHTNMDTCAGRERLIACGTAPTCPWAHLDKMRAATEATMLEVSTSGAVFLLALNDRHPCFERL